MQSKGINGHASSSHISELEIVAVLSATTKRLAVLQESNVRPDLLGEGVPAKVGRADICVSSSPGQEE